jgi:hypothetical protein
VLGDPLSEIASDSDVSELSALHDHGVPL